MTTIPFAQRFSCTIPEAEEGTGLRRSKLYGLMKAKEVESFRVGKRRLILVASLLRLASSRVESLDRSPETGGKSDSEPKL